jgi:hypothetical protein
MSNIGKDVDGYTPKQIRMRKATLKVFHRYWRRDLAQGVWFDVGAEESYMRDAIKPHARHFVTSFCDLDIDRFPWLNSQIQTVTSFDVLEHLYNPLYHLKELHRIMKIDATLYLSTPNDYSLIYKAEHLLSRKYPPHFHQYSERDLRNILKAAGFNIRLLTKFYRSKSGTIARISRNGLFVIAERSL